MAVIYGFKVNGTTYQYDYDHLANKPENLPEYYYDDEGKVLTVNENGELEWRPGSGVAIPSSEFANAGDVLMITGDSDAGPGWGRLLPAYDCDDNDSVLMIKNENLAWVHLIPGFSEEDAGSVLTVNEDGELAWLPLLNL